MFFVTKKIQYISALLSVATLLTVVAIKPVVAQQTSRDQFWQCISEVMVTYYDSEADAYSAYAQVVNQALLSFGEVRANALYPVTSAEVREAAAEEAIASFREILADTKQTYIDNITAARATFSGAIQECRSI